MKLAAIHVGTSILTKTIEKIKALGFSILAINVSEFEKLDGGLSCLNLRV